MASLLSFPSTTLIPHPKFTSFVHGNPRNSKKNTFSLQLLRIPPKSKVGYRPLLVLSIAVAPTRVITTERLRLDNLGPQPGSRKNRKRKGRGHAAGQGGSCGFGMRGQKSRSGPGARIGFEGGQTALYRRIPKLRGIAGGNLSISWGVVMLLCLFEWVCNVVGLIGSWLLMQVGEFFNCVCLIFPMVI